MTLGENDCRLIYALGPRKAPLDRNTRTDRRLAPDESIGVSVWKLTEYLILPAQTRDICPAKFERKVGVRFAVTVVAALE
jgi:hypothetical protein